MNKLAKTKTIGLTLSCLLLTACPTVPQMPDYPVDEPLYLADLTNGVCVERMLVDPIRLTYKITRELPLVKGGPCDHMVGYARQGWKKNQNWVREVIQIFINQPH